MQMTPQRWLARVGEYLALQLQADAAYSSTLAHNPMSQASQGRYRTDWLREAPYSLAELAAFVPKGFRRPIVQPRTMYGRNCTLFDAGMKWSGTPSHWGDWASLETHLWTMNASFIAPLGERELGGIVKSVIRYQRRNLESGKQRQGFLFIQSCRGKKGGKKSGEVRRAKTVERDAAIVAAVQNGESFRMVARAHKLSLSTVHHIVSRSVR